MVHIYMSSYHQSVDYWAAARSRLCHVIIDDDEGGRALHLNICMPIMMLLMLLLVY